MKIYFVINFYILLLCNIFWSEFINGQSNVVEMTQWQTWSYTLSNIQLAIIETVIYWLFTRCEVLCETVYLTYHI